MPREMKRQGFRGLMVYSRNNRTDIRKLVTMVQAADFTCTTEEFIGLYSMISELLAESNDPTMTKPAERILGTLRRFKDVDTGMTSIELLRGEDDSPSVKIADHTAKTKAAIKKSLPVKPRGLKKEASTLWDLVITERGSTLKRSDGPALVTLCKTWHLLQETTKLFEADPGDNKLRASYVSLVDAWYKLANKFGLSPTARATVGMGVGQPSEQDIANDELARRFLS